MTTTTKANGTGKATRRGFGLLPCLKCGALAAVTVNLCNLDLFTCQECSEEVEAVEIRSTVEKWAAVLAWCATGPELPEEE